MSRIGVLFIRSAPSTVKTGPSFSVSSTRFSRTQERHYKPAEEKPAEVHEKKTASQQEYQAKKFISKEEKRRKNRIAFLEKTIEETEGKMKTIEAKLANPAPEDDIMELTREYLELKRDLDAKTDEWVSLGSDDETSGK